MERAKGVLEALRTPVRGHCVGVIEGRMYELVRGESEPRLVEIQPDEMDVLRGFGRAGGAR